MRCPIYRETGLRIRKFIIYKSIYTQQGYSSGTIGFVIRPIVSLSLPRIEWRTKQDFKSSNLWFKMVLHYRVRPYKTARHAGNKNLGSTALPFLEIFIFFFRSLHATVFVIKSVMLYSANEARCSDVYYPKSR